MPVLFSVEGAAPKFTTGFFASLVCSVLVIFELEVAGAACAGERAGGWLEAGFDTTVLFVAANPPNQYAAPAAAISTIAAPAAIIHVLLPLFPFSPGVDLRGYASDRFGDCTSSCCASMAKSCSSCLSSSFFAGPVPISEGAFAPVCAAMFGIELCPVCSSECSCVCSSATSCFNRSTSCKLGGIAGFAGPLSESSSEERLFATLALAEAVSAFGNSIPQKPGHASVNSRST